MAYSATKATAKGMAKAKISQRGIGLIDDKEDDNGNQSMAD
jgi:hypothetical protein